MTESIFNDNFPNIKNNDELQKIVKKFTKYDPYYIASWCIKDRRIFFDKLWKKFKPYADKNFTKEIKKYFHQRSWEMYLGNILLNKWFQIKSNNEGPDFIIDNNIYIECIAPTKGDQQKQDSVPAVFWATNPKEIYAQDVPTDKMILRITQAIKEKAINQYEKWKTKKWFDKDAIFIVAINSGDLEHIQDYLNIPLVIKALFGLDCLQISQAWNQSFAWREDIKKWDITIPVNYFTSNEFNFVSGVIFSDKNILYYQENKDDCLFVNNPYAKNKIEKDCFYFLDQWNAEIENGITLTYTGKLAKKKKQSKPNPDLNPASE